MTTLKVALQEVYYMELEEIPSEEALNTDDKLTFSAAFERKMKKLIRRADHPIRYRVTQAAACLLLVMLLSGCTAFAISPEARAAFVGWIREVYETWFVYRYTGEEQPTLEDTVYLPTWVPEGYEEIVSPQAGTFVRIQYENDEKELLTVSYMKGTETSSLNVEWEGAVVQHTSVGRLPADLYLNPDDGPNILVWTDMEKDAAFWVTAPLAAEELVQVAESIQESAPMPKRYCVSLLPMNYGGYSDISVLEEDGRGETVYENTDGFSITFGYSNDAAYAPHPETESNTVYVWGAEAQLYPALEEGGDKSLLWTAEEGTTLWVCAPLPDDEMLQIAENVVVQLNRFTDLMELQIAEFDAEAPLLEGVEQALTDSFVGQVEDCARRDAQTGNRMSEEYNQLWKDQLTQYYVPPGREDALARISALTDMLHEEGRYGETIVSLFGPFYTASISVGHHSTNAHVCDERGGLIATYNPQYNDWVILDTDEEAQFRYVARQIYIEAYNKALSTLSNEK